MKNKFFKVTVIDKETGEQEVSNRVTNVKKFRSQYKGRGFKIKSEKLSDAEFEETEV